MALLFSNKVSSEFSDKVISISEKLNIDPNWLMFIVNFETGGTFSPSIQNKDTQATGLIQFIPSTATWLGTSIQALKNMDSVQQLDYVYEYLRRQQKEYGRFSSYHDLYLSIFYPKSIDKPDDYVLGIEKGSSYVQTLAQQNSGFDFNKDLKVTKSELKNWLDFQAMKVVPSELFKSSFSKKKTYSNSTREKSFSGEELQLA